MTVHGIPGSDCKDGNSARQSCRVVLPADVRPGESRLKIRLGSGKLVEAEVPKDARGGDTLVISLNDGKSWSGTLVRQEQDSPVSEGHDVTREFVAVVPEGVAPGKDQLMVRDGHGRQLMITVPKTARAGDQLIFKEDRSGQFRCSLSRHADEKMASRAIPTPVKPQRDLVIAIPADAKPGETMLPIDIGVAGGTAFGIRMPATARPGDHLALTLDEQSNSWIASIIRGMKADVKWKHLEFPCTDTDPLDIFEKLVSVVRSAGAFVSRKIARGSAPPLNVMGIVACADIQAGEDLVRMPAELHLTAANLKMLFPELFRLTAGMFFKGRNEEAAFSACVARLIGDSVNRRTTDLAETSAHASSRLETEAAMRVWEIYALALASEPFDRHPLVRSANDEAKVVAAMTPSKEHQHMKTFVGDIMFFYEQFSSHVQAELLGSGFTLASYWQARLSVLSRGFSLNGKDSLVPICDFFNHQTELGAEWHWDADTQAMVLTAIQNYKSGEEILISYGNKSNTSMFRCYGFGMHPAAELSWGYVCLPQNMPEGLYRQYLPSRMANFVFQLETLQVQDSLVSALNACLTHGCDAHEFLQSVCRSAISAYEDDASMKPALQALQLARAADAASSAWWQYISGDVASCCLCDEYPDWSEALICLRMSEYLCLTAHLEILDVFSGLKSEDQCLEGAKAVRETLLTMFSMLRAGHQVVLEESMP